MIKSRPYLKTHLLYGSGAGSVNSHSYWINQCSRQSRNNDAYQGPTDYIDQGWNWSSRVLDDQINVAVNPYNDDAYRRPTFYMF